MCDRPLFEELQVARELKDVVSGVRSLEKEAKASEEEAQRAAGQTTESASSSPSSDDQPANPMAGGNAALLAAIRAKSGAAPRRQRKPAVAVDASLLREYSSKVNEFVQKYGDFEHCISPEVWCIRARPRYATLSKTVEEMERNVKEVTEYFGEDPSRCTSENVFVALVQFVRAFKTSKDKVIRLRRAEVTPLSCWLLL